MDEQKQPENRIKKVDFSDIRLLIVGVVLLLIPIAYLSYSSRSTLTDKDIFIPGVAGKGGRQAFSFIQKQQKAAQAQGRDTRTLFQPANLESNWTSAVEKIRNRPTKYVDTGRETQISRMIFEADIHPDLKKAEELLYLNRPQEVIALAMQIMKQETENPLIQFLACSYLCGAYDQLEMQDEMKAAMEKLAELYGKLPNFGFRANIAAGMKNMGPAHQILSKLGEDTTVRQYIDSTLRKEGISDKMTVESVIDSTVRETAFLSGSGKGSEGSR